MPETTIGSADSSESQFVDYSVESETTDAPNGEKEFRYQVKNWNEYLGYYKTIPELQTAVDAKTKWIIGAGFEANPQTTLILGMIKGNGNDTFNSILGNMDRVKTFAGDSFAEIIRGEEGVLANLKPLDPSSIVTIFNSKGIITRYEQVSKNKKIMQTFEPEDIFHLSRNRIADEVHGISIIRSVKWIIDARNEAMSDWRTVLQRNVRPLMIFHLDTDDEKEIAAFKKTTDAAHAKSENMYVPKGVVVPELVATAQAASLNPITWINQLNDYFYQVVNTPQIIIGNAKEFTDASGKIVYLAFEQSVKAGQLYLEEQVLAQLNAEIFLTFPASLQQDTVSDTSSEGQEMELEEEPQEDAAQANDTTAEMEGKK